MINFSIGVGVGALLLYGLIRRRRLSRKAGKALGVDGLELEKNTLQHPLFAAVIEAMAEFLQSTNAPNFVSMTGYHPKLGPLEIIVQKKLGKTPADLVQKLKAEVAQLRQAEMYCEEISASDVEQAIRSEYIMIPRDKAQKLLEEKRRAVTDAAEQRVRAQSRDEWDDAVAQHNKAMAILQALEDFLGEDV